MKYKMYLLLCLMVKFDCGQFISRQHSKTPCEVQGTALVEHFFNLIFAEFQDSPPACTCVQMCPDQLTYCYPNGCFKKSERTKGTSPVSSIQQDARTTFLVNSDSEVFAEMFGNENLMRSSTPGNFKNSLQPSKTQLIDRDIPLKSKMVFQYKRTPKLQMKYNLREQIKHTRDKKAVVDLSKTRWPTNKHISRRIKHQSTSNYLTSILSESNQVEIPKYFKRYLTKRENQIGLDISALYLYKDASNFSLETLIDNLIEKGLEGVDKILEVKINNSSKLGLGDEDTELLNSVIDDVHNDTNEVKINNSSKLGLGDEDTELLHSVIDDVHNDTNRIAMKFSIKANYTNQNKTHCCYNENTTTSTYFEMITTLSKQIEKQNNLSMQAVGHLTGHKVSGDTATSDNVFNGAQDEISKSSLKSVNTSVEPIEATTTRILKEFIPLINSPVKKSKQRIVRKLRNKKLN